MNDLLANYRINAELHGKYTFSDDSKQTNQAYQELSKALSELVSNEADNLLFSLYDDADVSVQLWAAAHTLELDEKRAISKLQEIVALDAPIISMSARYTIKEWKDNGLRFR